MCIRDSYSGVTDYLHENRLNWQLVPLQFGFETTLMELAASGRLDGAIGTFISDRWIQHLTELGVRVVNLFNFSQISSVPSVCVDDFEIGVEAAAHLRAQGATRFAFCGPDSIYYTQLRRTGFARGLQGAAFEQLSAGSLLSDQIRQLSCGKGLLGIFCNSDRLAREFILEAHNQDLHCGHHYLIIGIDNVPSESIFAGISISSFSLPARKSGHAAAQALHQGSPPGLPPYVISNPARLIPRESSLATTRARFAQAATNYINNSLADPALDVETVARAIGSSRRILELACREQLNNSPYQIIAETRLAKAQQLLITTNLPVMEIGRRCGYPEPHHFSSWFKLKAGLSPKHFKATRTDT